MAHVAIELAAYRREVAEAYADARAGGGGEATWQRWRDRRDLLIGTSPQSPLPVDRRPAAAVWTTPFMAYDPSWRVLGHVRPTPDPLSFEIPHSSGGATVFSEVGTVSFTRAERELSLVLLWLEGYGGGLFLPFRDGTGGSTTYGGGRYLLDTVKGADLGSAEGTDGTSRLILDFNYAYHPSCAWDSAWSCPLAPPTNVLDVAVEAGELLPLG